MKILKYQNILKDFLNILHLIIYGNTATFKLGYELGELEEG
jgi:hypothetical protein